MSDYTPKDIERFWQKVDKSGGDDACWLWIAGKNDHGYGTFRIGSRRDGSRKTIGAHKVSWEIANGEVPNSLHVLHECDNPVCVNPAHLFLGTNLDNIKDKVSKGRGHHPVGESNGRAILLLDQVREIRETYAKGGISYARLARIYGCTKTNIANIVSRKIWK